MVLPLRRYFSGSAPVRDSGEIEQSATRRPLKPRVSMSHSKMSQRGKSYSVFLNSSELDNRQEGCCIRKRQGGSNFEGSLLFQSETACGRDVKVTCEGPARKEHNPVSNLKALDVATNFSDDSGSLMPKAKLAGIDDTLHCIGILFRRSATIAHTP